MTPLEKVIALSMLWGAFWTVLVLGSPIATVRKVAAILFALTAVVFIGASTVWVVMR